ncbi:MAG TPA: STAS domain-containing protein [Candidatus Krumholzibacteriaceae bacterium]|nr:STAS domain-containing protein [Candidatus Krumholzibacteriaceae bacterium]
MLTINTRLEDDVMIVGLKGQIDGGPKSQTIQDIVKKSISEGNINIVFDMSEIKWINSLGAGVLIASYASARRNDGYINLVGISDRVKVVLRTCGLTPTLFEEFDNIEDAVEDFKS